MMGKKVKCISNMAAFLGSYVKFRGGGAGDAMFILIFHMLPCGGSMGGEGIR